MQIINIEKVMKTFITVAWTVFTLHLIFSARQLATRSSWASFNIHRLPDILRQFLSRFKNLLELAVDALGGLLKLLIGVF